MPPLTGLNVIELPGNFGVRYAGRLFVQQGASVTQVRPAGTADASNEAISEAAFFDRGKAAIVADPTDADAVAALLANADVVLAGSIPPALKDAGLLTDNGSPRFPRLIVALVTEFGHTGPYADWQGSSLLGMASGGWLYINGDPDKEPLRGLEYHPYCQAGLHAFYVAMVALLDRKRSNLGQTGSTSLMQTINPLHEWTSVRYSHGGIIQRRLGNRYPVGYPIKVYRTLEGYWCLTVVDQQRLDLLLALAGHPEFVGDPRWLTHVGRNNHADEIDALVEPWLLTQTHEQLIEQFETIKLTAAPIRDLDQVLNNDVLTGRNYWEQAVLPDGREVRSPGPSLRRLETTPGGTRARRFTDMAPHDPKKPLAGVRVVDLTTGWSGPHGLRMLGDFGADVIRLEPPWTRGTVGPDEEYVLDTGFYIDNQPTERYWMTAGSYNKWNYNKRNVSVRLNTKEGKAVLEKLVASADVVIDNFSTQAWEKLGVTYEWMKSVNPAIIAVTMPGYGRWGPGRLRVSYGNQLEAFMGADSLMGYEGGEPHMFSIAWPDPVAGCTAAICALLGVYERDTTGEGQFYEVCQVEGATNFIGPDLVKYGMTGELPPRIGNKSVTFAPQGVYECAGDDRWLAVSVTSDAAWNALAGAIGRADLRDRSDLASVDGRRNAHGELDEAIRAWSAARDHKEAAVTLQAAGVAAFAVYDSRDSLGDQYLWDTHAFVKVKGEPLPGFPYWLSRTSPAVHLPVADVGEHNREALLEVGMQADEIESMLESGALATRPSL